MMEAGIVIRPITAADVNGWHATLATLCRERAYLAFTEAPPLEEARAFVHANLASGLPHFVLAAQGQIAGWCDVLPAADPRHTAQAHVGRLGMGLLPGLRGRGLGSALIDATLWQACTRFGRVELSVYSHNRRGLALYLSAGFVQEGVRREAWRLDGQVSDIIEMGLLARDFVPRTPRAR